MLLQEAIHGRRSMPVLGMPMPNAEQLEAVFWRQHVRLTIAFCVLGVI